MDMTLFAGNEARTGMLGAVPPVLPIPPLALALPPAGASALAPEPLEPPVPAAVPPVEFVEVAVAPPVPAPPNPELPAKVATEPPVWA